MLHRIEHAQTSQGQKTTQILKYYILQIIFLWYLVTAISESI